ncbi:hypothetical protein BN874_870028 [Candidatus Contendobacter odensis Run_B_J11]|uniref:Uncharacterized protein n=1 Tax=Candidatus Contendobacter odensis Run_B_J11 TaxID=1400861 RepID=A0A7U7GGE5_9GAMM|nr:hypothetical protein BN874_870028 [Candidatus Contendobacter odensis Run_B_J11]
MPLPEQCGLLLCPLVKVGFVVNLGGHGAPSVAVAFLL